MITCAVQNRNLAFGLLVFRYSAWRFRVQSVMCCLHTPSFTCRASCLTKNFRRQMVAVFRYVAWRFRVQSVMCCLHTPSFTCRASCLTKNFRRQMVAVFRYVAWRFRVQSV